MDDASLGNVARKVADDYLPEPTTGFILVDLQRVAADCESRLSEIAFLVNCGKLSDNALNDMRSQVDKNAKTALSSLKADLRQMDAVIGSTGSHVNESKAGRG